LSAVAGFLLVVSALCQGVMANVVFCTTGAGHAAFESAHGGTHAPVPGESGPGQSISEVSSASGMDSCSDIPVFKNDSYHYQRSNDNPIPGSLPILSVAQARISGSGIQTRPSTEKGTVFPFPTLLSLRTQILLI
jgi:hypothetical protein